MNKKNQIFAYWDVYLGMSDPLTGVDILERIKQSSIEGPNVFLLTVAMEYEDIIKRGKELGAIYLNKPLSYKEWLKVVLDLAENEKKGAANG